MYLQERGCENVDWIHLADIAQLWGLMNMVMSLEVPYMARNFRTI
jgi:hypothetical protein